MVGAGLGLAARRIDFFHTPYKMHAASVQPRRVGQLGVLFGGSQATGCRRCTSLWALADFGKCPGTQHSSGGSGNGLSFHQFGRGMLSAILGVTIELVHQGGNQCVFDGFSVAGACQTQFVIQHGKQFVRALSYRHFHSNGADSWFPIRSAI